jgi:hypothetical protein
MIMNAPHGSLLELHQHAHEGRGVGDDPATDAIAKVLPGDFFLMDMELHALGFPCHRLLPVLQPQATAFCCTSFPQVWLIRVTGGPRVGFLGAKLYPAMPDLEAWSKRTTLPCCRGGFEFLPHSHAA